MISDIKIFEFIDNTIDTSEIKFPENINDLYRYDDSDTKRLKYLLNFILESKVRDKIIDDLYKTLVRDEAAFSNSPPAFYHH